MENMDQSRTPHKDTSPVTPDKNKKMFAYGFLCFVVLVVAAVIAIGSYRIYRNTATDKFSVSVARVLHLPALKVNGVSIAYTDYVDDLKAIHIMRDYDKANAGQAAALSDTDLSDQVLMRQINNVIVAQAAKSQGVTVADSDVQALKDQVLQQFKTVAAVDTELMKRYGWNFATYEQKVMRPYVLQNKLNEKVQADPAARATIRAQAQSVLDQIKGGADFATLAKQFGQDGTAQAGGELGWFGKGEMVPQFENAAFALKKNELSQELVESPFGYHILQVEELRTTQTKDAATGKNVATPQVRARHILFLFPTLQGYLQKQLAAANIQIYLKVHNPVPDLLKPAANQVK